MVLTSTGKRTEKLDFLCNLMVPLDVATILRSGGHAKNRAGLAGPLQQWNDL